MQSNSQISWMLLYITTNIPGCKMLLEHWFDITLEQIPIMQMSGKFVMLLLSHYIFVMQRHNTALVSDL